MLPMASTAWPTTRPDCSAPALAEATTLWAWVAPSADLRTVAVISSSAAAVSSSARGLLLGAAGQVVGGGTDLGGAPRSSRRHCSDTAAQRLLERLGRGVEVLAELVEFRPRSRSSMRHSEVAGRRAA